MKFRGNNEILNNIVVEKFKYVSKKIIKFLLVGRFNYDNHNLSEWKEFYIYFVNSNDSWTSYFP